MIHTKYFCLLPCLAVLLTIQSSKVNAVESEGERWLENTEVPTGIYGDYDGIVGASVAINKAGNVMAVGYFGNQTEATAGMVKIFAFNNCASGWEQIGQDITESTTTCTNNAPVTVGGFGTSVALNADGTVVAVGAPLSDKGNPVNDADGATLVYRLNEGRWELFGALCAEQNEDEFGQSVAINAIGDLVLSGGPYNDGNDDNGGHVRMSQYNATLNAWSNVFEEDGPYNDYYYGTSVTMNDIGSVIGAGGPNQNGIINDDSGIKPAAYVGISSRDDTGDVFTIIDDPANDDEDVNYGFGWSVSLNGIGDGIAIGSPFYENGNVRFFKSNETSGNDWEQKGSTVHGTFSGDRFGYSVSTTTNEIGTTVAIGAPGSGSAPFTNPGYVRIVDYSNDYNDISLFTIASGIPTTSDDYKSGFGYSVALDANGCNVIVAEPFSNDKPLFRFFTKYSCIVDFSCYGGDPVEPVEPDCDHKLHLFDNAKKEWKINKKESQISGIKMDSESKDELKMRKKDLKKCLKQKNINFKDFKNERNEKMKMSKHFS